MPPGGVHQSGQDTRRPRVRPRVALAGDNAATLALAWHGSSVLLRIAHQVVAATGLADAVVALRAGAAGAAGYAPASEAALFHATRSTGHCPNGCGCWR